MPTIPGLSSKLLLEVAIRGLSDFNGLGPEGIFYRFAMSIIFEAEHEAGSNEKVVVVIGTKNRKMTIACETKDNISWQYLLLNQANVAIFGGEYPASKLGLGSKLPFLKDRVEFRCVIVRIEVPCKKGGWYLAIYPQQEEIPVNVVVALSPEEESAAHCLANWLAIHVGVAPVRLDKVINNPTQPVVKKALGERLMIDCFNSLDLYCVGP
jgi:hypothetical protein